MKWKISKTVVFLVAVVVLTVFSPSFYWWWKAQYTEQPITTLTEKQQQNNLGQQKESPVKSVPNSNLPTALLLSPTTKTTQTISNPAESKYLNQPISSTKSYESSQKVKEQTPIPRSLPSQPKKQVPMNDTKTSAALIKQHISWGNFVKQPFAQQFDTHLNPATKFHMDSEPIQCPATMLENLAKKRLSDADMKWCLWTLSPQGGNVVVGKSWGKLNTKEDKERFDALNCNAVQNGKNPTCDDSWGDAHITSWKKTPVPDIACSNKATSSVRCYYNDNTDMYCVMDNAQINFANYEKVSRGNGMTPSKKFSQNFLSTDCNEKREESKFPFPYLYSPQLSNTQCDIVYNGTLLLYSHDDIRNLGHTLNDIMNIWIMLWLEGVGRYAPYIDMLNIDSFKLGHNFDDKPNAFFLHYYKSLHDIFKGVDFKQQTLCVKKLMIQPIPPRFFIWESWFVDLPCSFVGPSTLYQRWNLHVRDRLNLLTNLSTNEKLKILLIVRNEHSNMWGAQRTSRNFLNADQISDALSTYAKSQNHEMIVMDLSTLSFEEQLRLLATISIIVGAHGAGIASSMHMSIGSKYCCGVLEIYPQGEFLPIKGHGNMARKMGIHYDRLDVSSQNSQPNGVQVPPNDLVRVLDKMVKKILQQPSCILSTVLNDPYLENING